MTAEERRDQGLAKNAIENRQEAIKERVQEWRMERLREVAGDEAVLDKISDDKKEIFLRLSRAEQKRIIDNNDFTMPGLRLEKFTERMYVKREIAKDKVQKWQAEYQRANAKYNAALKIQAERNRLFVEAKQKIKDTCVEPDSDECKAAEREAIAKAKEFLSNSIDITIEHLNQVKAKVEESDSLEEERVDEIVADIDAKVSELEDLRDEVDTADTKEEVKAAAQKLNSIWKEARHKARAFAAHLLNSKVSVIIKKSERLEERLECALEQMSDEEKDDFQEQIDNYSELLADADSDYEEAKSLYNDIRDMMDEDDKDNDAIQQKTEELKAIVKGAHDKLQKAHTQLTEMFRDMKAAGVDPAACKVDDTVVVDDSSESADEEEDEEEENATDEASDVDEEDASDEASEQENEPDDNVAATNSTEDSSTTEDSDEDSTENDESDDDSPDNNNSTGNQTS
jgi:hypothetical protein